ncbi:uncharacterized protein LOC133773470 [Lepus europaeus]|uniref:uncharacterized protein LOC133773470 n=1 Tax=Lepus europaeus TaxID=9983 RepID=UPI002B47181B|nr:uncharacterized protein LOC133773470 [Lepus europaeus]
MAGEGGRLEKKKKNGADEEASPAATSNGKRRAGKGGGEGAEGRERRAATSPGQTGRGRQRLREGRQSSAFRPLIGCLPVCRRTSSLSPSRERRAGVSPSWASGCPPVRCHGGCGELQSWEWGFQRRSLRRLQPAATFTTLTIGWAVALSKAPAHDRRPWTLNECARSGVCDGHVGEEPGPQPALGGRKPRYLPVTGMSLQPEDCGCPRTGFAATLPGRAQKSFVSSFQPCVIFGCVTQIRLKLSTTN